MQTGLKTVLIKGYEVELEWCDYDGDGPRPYAYILKGNYSASFEALEGEGGLTNEDTGDFRPVPQVTINLIDKWLNDQGYND